MTTDARAQYLAGLRDLATWLEQNPAQELPVSRTFNVPLTTNSAVKDWAADNGMSDAVQYDKEGNASVSLRFGPVALHMYGYVDFAEHCERSRGHDAREYAEKHGLVLVEAPTATDAATEAFVDVADAERYALRDEYVNGGEPLADWERELLANSVDPTPEQEAANAAELALAEAHHTADHDMATCTECRDQWEAEQAEDAEYGNSHFTRAQMDGEACTVCGVDFAEGEPTVPAGYDFIEGQLFAHLACVEAYDEPMTNRDVDPENADECDAYADAYSDTPIESGS